MTTCLFFDEMPIVRKVADRILKNAGYDAVVVETIAEAKAHLAANTCPAIVVLSATNGGEGVAETIGQVRRMEGGASAIVLVSMVQRSIGTLMRYRRAGANGLVMKPFEADDFADTLKSHLKAGELAA